MSCCIAFISVAAITVVCVKFLSCLWELVWPYLLSQFVVKRQNLRLLGEWAVVTGATDGIGKAYARILARDYGLNVALISRTEERLKTVAEEIKAESAVAVKTFPFDFSTMDLAAYENLKNQLSGLDVGVLVNNVGVAYDFPEVLHEFPGGVAEIQKMIQVNCAAATIMTYQALPKMVEKKKGAIVNISSGSGIFPSPLITVYSASKAYVDFFTRGLQMEYKNSGIIIQSVAPFYVATKLARLRHSTFFAPDPDSYAKSALSTLGVQDFSVGYFTHGLQLLAIRLVPESLSMKAAYGILDKVRQKAKAKKREKTN